MARTIELTPAAVERFWAKVAKTNGCWLWTGSVGGGGYGMFIAKGTGTLLAHRVAYTLVKGDISPGLTIDHLCRVRACVNPDHLEPVTQAENVRRGLGPQLTRARHRAITHCPRGHEYSPHNTRVTSRGSRLCKTCQRVFNRDSMRRRRAAQKQVA